MKSQQGVKFYRSNFTFRVDRTVSLGYGINIWLETKPGSSITVSRSEDSFLWDGKDLAKIPLEPEAKINWFCCGPSSGEFVREFIAAMNLALEFKEELDRIPQP